MGKYPVIVRMAKSHGSRNKLEPNMVVLHHTAGSGNTENEVSYLQSNSAGVSIHVCIAKDGTRYRMVDDERSAYHVGYSKVSLGNANQVSLGIELINKGRKVPPFDDYPDAQVESCAEQVVEWMAKYNIMVVTSHEAIDTRGKFDPWRFPWKKFWMYVGEAWQNQPKNV